MCIYTYKYIYIYVYTHGNPPTRAYLDFLLVVFAAKKTIIFVCPAFCVIYILPFLWVFEESSRLVGTKSDSSCPQGILVKSLFKKVVYAKHA